MSMTVVCKNGDRYEVKPQALTRRTDQHFRSVIDDRAVVLPRWAIAELIPASAD